MATFEDRARLLDSIDIQYIQASKWKDKRRQDLELFESVELPLDPDHWCSLCMSEGASYVGGCCGTMSHVQDLLEHVFRMGNGYIRMNQFANLVEAILDHGDFEGKIRFDKLDRSIEDIAAEAKDCSVWESYSPWDLIALTWHLTKDFYSPKTPTPYNQDFSEVEKAIHTLHHGASTLSWALLCQKTSTPDGEFDLASQSRGNRSVLLYRLIPALRTLFNRIDELDAGPFDGVALVDTEIDRNAIAHNNLGLCIFGSEEDARKLVALLDEDEAKKIELRPVQVSKENGVVFKDSSEPAKL